MNHKIKLDCEQGEQLLKLGETSFME